MDNPKRKAVTGLDEKFWERAAKVYCAERDEALKWKEAYRQVAIQERKDLEQMEDNFQAEGGFTGHREGIEEEIEAEALEIVNKK